MMDAPSDGRLVMPFAEEAGTGLGYYPVTSLARGNDQKMSVFKTWKKKETGTESGK